MNAQEFRELANEFNSNKTSPLCEELFQICEKEAKKGKYRYIHYLEDYYGVEELNMLKENLKMKGLEVTYQTVQTTIRSPKWYEFMKREEYKYEIRLIIDWS